MSIQLSTTVRNALLDSIETAISTGAVLKIRTGAAPVDVTTADSGTVLATLTLPTDWMNAASGGTKTLLGSWADSSADAAGTAQHFRIYASNGTTQHLQGTITSVLTGTGDMLLDNTVLAAGQAFSITTFTLTAPGA